MKVDFICINPDNTTTEKRCNIKDGKVQFSKKWQPQLKAGKSIFPHATKQRRIKFLPFKKRRKRYVWAPYGAPRCFELSAKSGMLDAYWNTREGEKFISKLVALSAVNQKPFSNFQVYLLFGGLMACLVIGALILRRVGIG